MKVLILASNSPRRSELLALTELLFTVQPTDINEKRKPGEPPADYVCRLAHQKAKACAEEQQGFIIAADTIVADGDFLLGKPKSKHEATQMLHRLRGRTHQVYTGLAVLDTDTGRSFAVVCCTDVPMRNYSDAEIEAYVSSGDPMDKAGAYAIQHSGFRPVEGLRGCYASVMGFPLCHLKVGMKTFDFSLPADLPHRCQAHLSYICPVFGEILSGNAEAL